MASAALGVLAVLPALLGVSAAGQVANRASAVTSASATLRIDLPPITTNGVRLAETDAGNLVADAVRVTAAADISLVPAGAFRTGASIMRPATGEQAAILVDPANEEIVTLSLRGDKIMEALERSVLFAPLSSANFLQVSGLHYTYDLNKESGRRVVSVILMNGQPLDAARTYKVGTTSSLAAGTGGLFVGDKSAISAKSGKSLAVSLADYGHAHANALSPSVEGRITVIPLPVDK